MILLPLPLDRSFEDDDSVDGNRSSSAQTFKVPKVPKKPADSSAARRPSATGGKLGKYGFDLSLHHMNLHISNAWQQQKLFVKTISPVTLEDNKLVNWLESLNAERE